jgi:hypothetical protein
LSYFLKPKIIYSANPKYMQSGLQTDQSTSPKNQTNAHNPHNLVYDIPYPQTQRRYFSNGL